MFETLKQHKIILTLSFILTTLFAVFSFYYKYTFINSEWAEENILFKSAYQLNAVIYDQFFKSKSTKTKADQALLVAIDEDSVRELGRWPWSRQILSQIYDEALKYGAKSLSNDVIYSESENAESDQNFYNILNQYNEKIILGVYGNSKVAFQNPAYQDYCFNEVFMRSEGENIVKLNINLIVDDDKIEFEQLDFKEGFKTIFDIETKKVQTFYLQKFNKIQIEDLTENQKNIVHYDIIKNLFNYCHTWLTPKDNYFSDRNSELLEYYSQHLNQIEQYKKLDLKSKIKAFKKDVKIFLIPQLANWSSNIKLLQKSLQNTATFNVDIDLDGVVRKYPLIYRTGNKLGSSYIPSLALQSYLSSTGYQAYFQLKTDKNYKTVSQLQIKNIETEKIIQTIPIDSNGRLIINYYGKANTLPFISAKDLFNKDQNELTVYTHHEIKTYQKSEYLKDKTLILGATAMGIYDLRNTPVDKIFPGPEIHLTVLQNIFDQNYFRVLKNEFIYLILFFIISNILLGLSFILTNIFINFSIFIIFNIVLFFTTQWLFSNNFQFQFLSIAITFLFINFGLILIYVYFFETRKSQNLKNTFSKYVDSSIVEEILKNKDLIELKGQKLNMTVYFSDIRGFTSFSEKMDPQDLSQMLNLYFNPTSKIIFKNNGTIDKFIGDAVMALFGAPINYKDHEIMACKAALENIEHLKSLNLEFKERNWPQIDIGIGLNSGVMVAGNIGSDSIQSYTVIGDEVNLGSRLEGLTKEYGVHILISESTHKEVYEIFKTREVDQVKVKGKNEPVKIFQLIENDLKYLNSEYLESYHKALSYYRQKEFEKAENIFKALQKIYAYDKVVCIYLERIEFLKQTPPESDWDGVYTFTTK